MTAFTPANPLEQSLLEAQQGKLPQGDFVSQLMASKVFVLLEKPVTAAAEWDNTNSPLVLNSPNEFPVLVIFTSEARSTPSAENSAHYKFPFEVDFSLVLRGVQPTLGLVVNPGSQAGFEMAPEAVVELKQAFGITPTA